MKTIPLLSLVVLFAIFPMNFHAQLKEVQAEKIEELEKNDPKTILIFLYTDWCSYCKQMENTTLKDKTVEQTLNKNFYFLPMNAEEKNTIDFWGHAYPYVPRGSSVGNNELALTLNKSGNYPFLCILNPKKEIVFEHVGFLSKKELLMILKN